MPRTWNQSQIDKARSLKILFGQSTVSTKRSNVHCTTFLNDDERLSWYRPKQARVFNAWREELV